MHIHALHLVVNIVAGILAEPLDVEISHCHTDDYKRHHKDKAYRAHKLDFELRTVVVDLVLSHHLDANIYKHQQRVGAKQVGKRHYIVGDAYLRTADNHYVGTCLVDSMHKIVGRERRYGVAVGKMLGKHIVAEVVAVRAVLLGALAVAVFGVIAAFELRRNNLSVDKQFGIAEVVGHRLVVEHYDDVVRIFAHSGTQLTYVADTAVGIVNKIEVGERNLAAVFHNSFGNVVLHIQERNAGHSLKHLEREVVLVPIAIEMPTLQIVVKTAAVFDVGGKVVGNQSVARNLR